MNLNYTICVYCFSLCKKNVISQNGNVVSSSVALSKKALKGMYYIKSCMCSISELPFTLSTHLFDSLVRPILTYYYEIWNMAKLMPQWELQRVTIKLITLMFLVKALLTKFSTIFVNIF